LTDASNKKKKSRGFLGQTVSVIIGVITIVLLLVVANVMLGQLNTLTPTLLASNTSSAFNNTTAAIASGFSLLSVALGIVTLLVVVSLLWLCVSIFMGGGMLGGGGGGRGRNRR